MPSVERRDEPDPEVPHGERIEDIRAYRPAFVGMVGLVCVPFLVWAVYPLYSTGWAIGLTVWWLFLTSLGIAWFMRSPRRLPWLPVLAVLAWLAVVLLARA